MESTLRVRDFYMLDKDGNVYVDDFGNKNMIRNHLKENVALRVLVILKREVR